MGESSPLFDSGANGQNVAIIAKIAVATGDYFGGYEGERAAESAKNSANAESFLVPIPKVYFVAVVAAAAAAERQFRPFYLQRRMDGSLLQRLLQKSSLVDSQQVTVKYKLSAIRRRLKATVSHQADAVVKVRVVGSADEVCLIPTPSPFNSIGDMEGFRVNICQNIWSLLRGCGVNRFEGRRLLSGLVDGL